MPNLPPEVLSSLAARRLNITNQRDTGLQQLGNQYNTNLYNLGQYSNDAARRINDQYASQGTFNSGIRVNEQGRLQQNVGERRGFLGQQYAQQQAGLQSQYQNAMDAITSEQNAQMAEATRRELDQQQQQAQFGLQQQQFQYQQQQDAINRWNAALAQNQQAAQPAPDAVAQWYAEAQRQEAARILWYTTIMNQNNQERNYAGAGNALGYAGATFR